MSSDSAHNDEFYLRYYVGHKGRFGHEFMVRMYIYIYMYNTETHVC